MYPEAVIGMEFRSSHFSSHKLRKAPAGDEDEVNYLARLVKAMIAYDLSQLRYLPGVLVAPEVQTDIARELPVIDPGHVCAYSAKLKADEKKRAATLMAVEDDADLLDLEAKYKGKLLYENDEGQDITWQVTEIVHGKNSEFEYWERPWSWLSRETELVGGGCPKVVRQQVGGCMAIRLMVSISKISRMISVAATLTT